MTLDSKSFTNQILEKLRTKLLDLSGRNNLISYKHQPRSQKQIRIIDESLTHLLSKLCSEETSFRFKSVPEPELEFLDEMTNEFISLLEEMKSTDTDFLIDLEGIGEDPSEKAILNIENNLKDKVREKLGLPKIKRKSSITVEDQAIKNNINPSYELLVNSNEEKHVDEYIQTLLYEEDLKKKLKNIYEFNKLNETETGVSTLFCTIGFLEWYESDHSEKKILSPLILLPIGIERTLDKGEHDYKIQQRGEEIAGNDSLSEKLINDFGISFPDFDLDQNLDEYFNKCEEIIKKNKNWKIRRFSTIGFFSFAKFLMYKDLKNENLVNVNIEESLVSKIINGTERVGGISFAEDYNIDEVENVKIRIPDLITDADSSQISAILDVLSGKNLVIEGPPGTGKSQTITNIIAACLAEGKKVLFLAEKNAALQVVKVRMDKAGLGDFCFELHSNKLQKNIIYDNLKNGIKIRANKTHINNHNEIKENIHRTKEELKKYISIISQTNEIFGMTYNKLIWKKIQLEDSFDSVEIKTIQKINWIFREKYSECLEILEKFQSKFIECEMKDLKNGAWSFLDYKKVTPFNYNDAFDDLLIVEEFSRCKEINNELSFLFNLKLSEIQEICKITKNVKNLSRINQRLVDDVVRQRVNLSDVQLYLQIQLELKDTESKITTLYRGEKGRVKFSNENEFSYLRGKYPDENISGLALIKKQLENDFNLISNVNLKIKMQVRDLDLSLDDLTRCRKCLEKVINLKQAEVPIIQSFVNASNGDKLHLLKSKLKYLDSLQKEIEYYFVKEVLGVDIERVHFWKKTVSSSGVFSIFSGKFRKIKNEIKEYLKHDYEKFKVLKAIESVQSYLSVKNEVVNDFTYQLFLKNKYEINIHNIDSVEEVYLASNDILNGTSLFWSEESSPMFLMDIKEITELCKDIQVVENGYRSLRVINQSEFKGESLKIIEEITTFSAKISDFEDIHNLKLYELFKLSDLNSLYISQKNSLETLKHQFSYLGSVDQVVIECTIIFLISLKEASLEELLKNHLAELLSADAASVINVDEFCLKLGSSLDGYIAQWCMDDSLKKHLSVLKINDFVTLLRDKKQLLKLTVDFYSLQDMYRDYEILKFILLYVDIGIETLKIRKAFEYFVLNQECTKFFKENPFLMINAGTDLNLLRDKFSNLDKDLMKNYQLKLKSELLKRPITQGISVGRVSDKTELGFIEHQFQLKMRHAPVRNLLKKSPNAIQDIMPCFMMSPLTLAQYIPIGSLEFDVLIMDEASQLRPEDSIGALFRAKQVIVVGDPKQLPPSTFFDNSNKQNLVDEEDENGVTASDIDHESILDMAIKSFTPARRLRWHYRSKHQDLISFSNKKFYDEELVVFPSPVNDHELFGVEMIYLKDAIYENKRNVKEAEEILNWMQKFILKYPEKSIAIVTMNQPQQELINDMYLKRLKDDPVLEAYAKNKEESLENVLIKNLENIQGDERDVILISTVYGKEPNAIKPHQRFGEINKKMGHRRLNVLFTRARYKNVIFTSLDSTDIIPTDSSSNGVHIFKDYLSFARNKIIPDAASSGVADSDFEVFVIRELKKKGYEVTCQVGVSGYKIDIGVIDPNNKGRFLCGIECDGATYHSAKSVRDRDKIRQEILESLGWNIYRIWSTDWFSNKDHEVKKLITYLNKLTAEVG